MLARLVRSKGWGHLVRRAVTIVQRTGFTARRMQQALDAFSAAARRFGVRPTFPVTAAALHRQPALFHRLLAGDAPPELAIHGLHHVDLSEMNPAEQEHDVARAKAVFQANGIPFAGFRAPYLRWNDTLLASLETAGIWYDSSHSILWPVVSEHAVTPAQREGLQRLKDFCQPLPAQDHPALPRWRGDLLEIPVSLPDDEMLLDRLDLRQAEDIAALWWQAFQQCHQRGELFVMQVHPERFPLCADAVSSVLQKATEVQPPVWLASLVEITAWWKEKRELRCDIVQVDEALWEVHASGPERAALLVRGGMIEGASEPWSGDYRLVRSRDFQVRAATRPSVGLSPAASLELVQFLSDQGYVVEASADFEEHAVPLTETALEPHDMLPLLNQIEADSTPLVRWARWPHAAGSALAIGGDVDALTVWDYLRRPFER